MVKVTPRQLKCRSMLEALGYSRAGSSALTGNFCQESGPNLPTAFRTTGLDHGSNGLAQWRLSRLLSYKAYVQSQKPELVQAAQATGKSLDEMFWPWYGRLDFQTQFVAKELAKDYPALDQKLRKGGDVAALTADVCWQYERPSKLLSGIANRIAWAKAIAADTTEGVAPLADITHQPTVVDQLHNTILEHDNKATGGYAAAAIGTFAGAGVLLSNVIHDVPTWQWVLVGIIAVIVLLAILGAIAERRNATNVAQALPGVTPVPLPPAASVAQAGTIRPTNEIGAAMADSSRREDDIRRSPIFALAVQAEVDKQVAALRATQATVDSAKASPIFSGVLTTGVAANPSTVDPAPVTHTMILGN